MGRGIADRSVAAGLFVFSRKELSLALHLQREASSLHQVGRLHIFGARASLFQAPALVLSDALSSSIMGDAICATDLCAEFPSARPLGWLPSFYVLPPETSLAHRRMYKDAQILALDPSSALAVASLCIEAGDDVLDLCCAPGMKLVLIARQTCPLPAKPQPSLAPPRRSGSVTGVDISKERVQATVGICKKYKVPSVRIFHSDGAAFGVPPHCIEASPRKAGRPLSSKFSELYDSGTLSGAQRPLYASTSIRRFPGHFREDGRYDKVLVDAPCTHDGSIKHVQKLIATDWREFAPEDYEEEQLERLYALQLALLERAFALVRLGGLVVYSTCSMTVRQNEAIIEAFMAKAQAGLPSPDPGCAAYSALIEEPIGPRAWHTAPHPILGASFVRVPPSPESGGALFICRLRKISLCQKAE